MEIFRRPEAAFLTYEKFKQDLPVEGSDFYARQVKGMEEANRKILITALRWLVCAGDTIDMVLVADELSQNFTQKNRVVDKQTPEALETFSKCFLEIGQDILKVTGTTLQLEHSSVRDFVVLGKDANFAQAGGAEGHLRMAEHLIRTLNTPGFQKRYLSKEAIKRKKMEPLRYELANWPKHLRCTDVALKKMEHPGSLPRRWNTLLDEVERFMSPQNKVFGSWLEITSTAEEDRTKDSALHTASRYGIPTLVERLLKHEELDARNKTHVSLIPDL